MKRWVPRTVLASVLLWASPSGLAAGNLSADVDGIRVELTSEPERPGTKQPTAYVLRLTDAQGMPLSGAKVTLQGRMADGMMVLAPLRPATEPGIYRGRVLFTMEGPWTLRLRVSGTGKPVELLLTEQVGR
jgi:hypothetical protein